MHKRDFENAPALRPFQKTQDRRRGLVLLGKERLVRDVVQQDSCPPRSLSPEGEAFFAEEEFGKQQEDGRAAAGLVLCFPRRFPSLLSALVL